MLLCWSLGSCPAAKVNFPIFTCASCHCPWFEVYLLPLMLSLQRFLHQVDPHAPSCAQFACTDSCVPPPSSCRSCGRCRTALSISSSPLWSETLSSAPLQQSSWSIPGSRRRAQQKSCPSRALLCRWELYWPLKRGRAVGLRRFYQKGSVVELPSSFCRAGRVWLVGLSSVTMDLDVGGAPG